MRMIEAHKLTYLDTLCSSKDNFLTSLNKVSVGEKVYESLHPEIRAEFHKLAYRAGEWKYINRDSGKLYRVYALN